jgi:UDP-N-acetyl-D-galactosamine dehydrogenase
MNGKELAIRIVKTMLGIRFDIYKSKTLVMGVGFAKNGEYFYDTEIIDLVQELDSFHLKTHLFDPHADTQFLKTHYDINCKNNMMGFGAVSTYNVIILGTIHDEFRYPNFKINEHKRGKCLIYDDKNFFPDNMIAMRL